MWFASFYRFGGGYIICDFRLSGFPDSILRETLVKLNPEKHKTKNINTNNYKLNNESTTK